jgi:hypothetical protein
MSSEADKKYYIIWPRPSDYNDFWLYSRQEERSYKNWTYKNWTRLEEHASVFSKHMAEEIIQNLDPDARSRDFQILTKEELELRRDHVWMRKN